MMYSMCYVFVSTKRKQREKYEEKEEEKNTCPRLPIFSLPKI